MKFMISELWMSLLSELIQTDNCSFSTRVKKKTSISHYNIEESETENSNERNDRVL